jgi:ribosomal protein S18 acetylase RimI-like enzyme
MEITLVKILNEKDEIKFRIIQPDDLEQTVDLCSQVFANYEPMTRALKINCQEFKTFAESYCRKAIEDGLSIVATDSNEKVVGFVISEDLMTEPPLLDDISDKFEPLLALLHELDSSYTSKHSLDLELGQILHIFMLGVQDEYKNQKIEN